MNRTAEDEEKDLYHRMKELNPERNPVFTAIEHLKTPEEIREFHRGYVAELKERVEDSKKDPEKLAIKNIGYILGYYDSKTAERWEKALPVIRGPINIFL